MNRRLTLPRRALLTTAALGLTLLATSAAARLPWRGYLSAEALDRTLVVPPPPAPDSATAQADRAAFLASRALEGTPRWNMAIVDLKEADILQNLSCAIGADLNPLKMRHLTGLLIRMAPDVSRAVSRPKHLYGRPRPYLVDEGTICTARSKGLARSPDYPSGHATWSWAVGLVMAELVPERSTQILTRARAFGESRIVCGVHNASSVAAGRINATSVVAALHGSPAFREDMAEARVELARALKHPRPPQGCEAEAEALATPLD